MTQFAAAIARRGRFTQASFTRPAPDLPPPGADPLALPNLLFAYDANRSPITFGSGQSVSGINDLGSGQLHLAQPLASQRLIYEPDTIKGGPAFRADGNQCAWRTGSVLASRTGYAIYLLLSGSAIDDRRVYAEASTTSWNALFNIGTRQISQPGRLRLFHRTEGGTVLLDHGSQAVVFDGTPRVVCVSRDGNQVRVWVDGVLDSTATVATGTIACDRIAIAAVQRSELWHGWTGRLAAIYGYGSPRTVEQATVVEDYLNSYPALPGGASATTFDDGTLWQADDGTLWPWADD